MRARPEVFWMNRAELEDIKRTLKDYNPMNDETQTPIPATDAATAEPVIDLVSESQDPLTPTTPAVHMTDRHEFFLAQEEPHRRHNRRPKAFISQERFNELLDFAIRKRIRVEDRPQLTNALLYGLMTQSDFDALEAAEAKRAQRRERNRRQWAKSSG